MVRVFLVLLGVVLTAGAGHAADTVPTDIQQPGTQPEDAVGLESVTRCDNCHSFDDTVSEPWYFWQGSMMAQATRDPIFWATLAIAEQDFDGSGDLCIRCHSTLGWYGGRSTPTDGSGLRSGDAQGVTCDFCHKMTNPDVSEPEFLGVQVDPFIAHDGGSPPEGYYGSGMAVLSDEGFKLGPYNDVNPPHQFRQSLFHRSVEFCGTCHDVSNPAVGDLAPNHGAQSTADPVIADGTPGSAVGGKAAFNNLPFQYGIVERTFSEYMASVWPTTRVSSYGTLPEDVQDGAVEIAYTAALLAGNGGDYADGAPRYFTCQTCHVPPTTGLGCGQNGVPVRDDVPVHDMTGGNYWMPDVIQYLDGLGYLRLGGGLGAAEIAALDAGKLRAIANLQAAASLEVNGNTLKVTNLTGHKLISGYPEGRRMWLHITWYDGVGAELREDGEYGPMTVDIDGTPTVVHSLVDLHDPNTKVYEAHYGLTQEWAAALVSLGWSGTMALSYDRTTGAPDYTLGDLATSAPGTEHESFHFVLNNTVVKDNRIPPLGMDSEEARKRNALPVPFDQYGVTTIGEIYNAFDLVQLDPPVGAASADIELLYQPTSWEYIQFLDLANTGSNAFLANEGAYLLDAWLNTGMAAPQVMATASWRPECSASTTLGTDEWTLVSLPCDVGSSDQLQQALQGLDPLTYGDRWEFWERDEAANSYRMLDLADPLVEGVGYWIKTLDSGRSVTVTGTFNGAIDAPLQAVATGRQNLVGFPHTFTVPWSAVRFVAGGSEITLDEADPDVDGQRACATVPPDASCRVSRLAYVWNGAAYQAFDGRTPGMIGSLSPFDGVWVKAFESGASVRFSLGAAGARSPRPPAEDGSSWFVRLIAEDGAGLRDAGNVFGQHADSDPGPDTHDLIELPPFSGTYLTVVFPHEDWGEAAGDYASDFHPLAPGRDRWRFVVRASADVESVTLRWRGQSEQLKNLWLTDPVSRWTVSMAEQGSYTYRTQGGAVPADRAFVVVYDGE